MHGSQQCMRPDAAAKRVLMPTPALCVQPRLLRQMRRTMCYSSDAIAKRGVRDTPSCRHGGVKMPQVR